MPIYFRRVVIRMIVACALFAVAPSVMKAKATRQNQIGEDAYRIAYHVAMPNPKSHLFEVRVEVELNKVEEFIEFQMPRWSPGRYGVFEFAKNMQEVYATPDCRPGERCDAGGFYASRIDTQTWRVPMNGSKRLTLRYKVFGDDLSGTFSQLDERHANYNGASLFMYVVGHKQDPLKLTIEPLPDWKIVNGYTTRADQREWQFANYDILIDTPTEIAPDLTIDEFKVDSKLYRVAVHSFGSEGGKRAALVRDVEKIVRAETAMWGAPDFDAYTFMFHFAPDALRGDGMEHLTSTQVIETCALADEGCLEEALSTAAHEFFHVWNVKRLRPVGLGPWDFTKPVVTRGLWIAEGFTNYYGHLMLRRAGLWDERRLLDSFAETITNVETAPGSRLTSAEESSISAPFIDRSGNEQLTNLLNTSISYYPKGEVLALALDLLIRGKTGGRASLDDVMRRAYEEFYVRSPKATYYLKGRGFTNEEFARVTSEVVGTDMTYFFDRYARRTETPPYEEAFAQVGLRLVRRTAASEPFSAGITTDLREGQNARIVGVGQNSAAERAGLRQGDVIVSIGKTNVTSLSWRSTLNVYKDGDSAPMTVRRGRQTINATLKLDAPDRVQYLIEEMKDAPPQARAFRAAWLKGKG